MHNGVIVEVVAPVPWVPPGFTNALHKWNAYSKIPRDYVLNGVKIHRPRYLQFIRGDNWANPHRAYYRCVNRCIPSTPDLVHAHFAYPPGSAAIMWARSRDIPAVLTLRGDDVNTFPYRNMLCRSRFAAAVRAADTLLSVSTALAEHTKRQTGRLPDVMLTGVNPGLFDRLPDKKDARRTLGYPEDKRVVLYVGALLSQKGIAELLEVLTILSRENVIGVMVGEGPLREEASSCPFVRLMGVCDHGTVLLHMRAADVLVLPTYNEGMPSVLVEAGWVGLPVVASAVGGIPELLGKSGGIMIEPRNAQQLLDGIRSILEDPTAANRNAGNLNDLVKMRYNADENSRKLIEHYRHAIDGFKSRNEKRLINNHHGGKIV